LVVVLLLFIIMIPTVNFDDHYPLPSPLGEGLGVRLK